MAGDIIFGMNALREALQAGQQINRVYVAKESRAHGMKALLDEIHGQRIPCDTVPQAKLNQMTGTQEHQGIAAKISPVGYLELGEFLSQCPENATLLILDQLHNPKNVGMLIRSALGSGCHGVLLPERGGTLIDQDIIRASAGTALRMSIVTCKNVAQAMRTLRDHDFWVYGLDAAGEQSVFEMEWPARTALLLGNETKGIRPGVRKQCDAMVSIPLANGVESLNVAVAGSVALFQAGRTCSQD